MLKNLINRDGPMLKWIWLAVLIIIVDQLTKQIASSMLQMHQPVAVIPMFNWTLMHNTGAAFSFLSDESGWQRWFFTFIALLVSLVLIGWISKLGYEEKRQAISFSLVLGGALGNVIDRILFGYVIDFIDVYYQQWHWPAFNIADSAITIGIILLLVDSFLQHRQGAAGVKDNG